MIPAYNREGEWNWGKESTGGGGEGRGGGGGARGEEKSRCQKLFFPGNWPGCSPFFFVLVKIVL